jgi:predicted nucleic acid-binding protein
MQPSSLSRPMNLSMLDKAYSLTDCISMNAMRERGLTDILTNDHHFTQEGFHILL